jgi:hypothetical protein
MFFKKSSDEWHKDYTKKYKMIIYDADGWDRKNFNYSWFKEKITWKEFCTRALNSSQMPFSEKNSKLS